MSDLEKPDHIDDCEYFTKRLLGDDNEGNCMVWMFKGEEKENIEYTCPECGYSGELRKKFHKPIRWKCEECGESFMVTKLNPK